MKLATERRKGFTLVRGGRIVITRREIEVPRDGIAQAHGNYDMHDPVDLGVVVEEAMPYTPRPIESDGVTTRVGDIAIEILNVDQGHVIGHYFLSGPATAIVRYIESTVDLDLDFEPARSCRVDVDPVTMPNVEHRLFKQPRGTAMGIMASCMVELTHRYHLAYFGNLHVPNTDTMSACVGALHKVFSISYEGAPVKTAHMIGSVHCPSGWNPTGKPHPKKRGRRDLTEGQPVAYVHMQPPQDVSTYCAAPFAHELLETAGDDIETVDFWALDADAELVVPL